MNRLFRRRETVALSFVIVSAVALLLAGVGVGIALAPRPVPDSLAQPSLGTFPVVEEDFLDSRTVALTPVLAPDSTIAAPRGGVLTSSSCTVGSVWRSGTFPFAIDEEPTLVLHTTVPLWRSLDWWDRGGDVLALQQELLRLEKNVAETAQYDGATIDSVTGLFAEGGVSSDGSLPRSSASWMASPEITITECAAQLGSEVGAGTPIARIDGPISVLSITSTPSNLVPGNRVLRIGSVEVPMDATYSTAVPEALAVVAGTDEFRVYRATDGEAALTGRLELAEPVTIVSLPPSAIGQNAEASCVTLGGKAYVVTVVQSSLGRALVTFRDITPAAVDIVPSSAECS